MKKRKIYEISVIDKTYSKTVYDETKFYTSDTALELVFKLKETEYTFESAEIVLLNNYDRSLVTRPVAKVDNDFVYELDDDVIAHYGDWQGQLRFEKDETYVSSPINFNIEDDLSNGCPPQLSDVQSWVGLKRYADGLTEELKQAVLSIEEVEDTFNENETVRQSRFSNAEQSRQDTFKTNENERDKAENQRQTVFEDNEASRFETFNTNEVTRQENEKERKQAESQRQSTFEASEIERQTTFETAEQERQSAELIRVENENQRNLTSVDEFIKLQNAIGGRNLVKGTSDEFKSVSFSSWNYYVEKNIPVKGETYYTLSARVIKEYQNQGLFIFEYNDNGVLTENHKINLWYRPEHSDNKNSLTIKTKPDTVGVHLGFRNNQNGTNRFRYREFQLELGNIPTDWSPAPEDYEVVYKEDYYNHIKLMNNFKNNQFNKLKQAVISLGGTI